VLRPDAAGSTLVNDGAPLPAPHQDAARLAHDDDPGCVLHHASATDLVAARAGGAPDPFDAASRRRQVAPAPPPREVAP